jgi:hypothetical protein
MSRGP